MSSRLRFTHNRPANTDNHYVVGSGIGSKSRFVRSALRRRSSNNAQGKPCCSSKNKIPENKSCLNGMVWKECGSACTRTCSDPEPICTKQCVPKCECPQGHVLDGGNCVDVKTCEKKTELLDPEPIPATCVNTPEQGYCVDVSDAALVKGWEALMAKPWGNPDVLAAFGIANAQQNALFSALDAAKAWILTTDGEAGPPGSGALGAIGRGGCGSCSAAVAVALQEGGNQVGPGAMKPPTNVPRIFTEPTFSTKMDCKQTDKCQSGGMWQVSNAWVGDTCAACDKAGCKSLENPLCAARIALQWTRGPDTNIPCTVDGKLRACSVNDLQNGPDPNCMLGPFCLGSDGWNSPPCEQMYRQASAGNGALPFCRIAINACTEAVKQLQAAGWKPNDADSCEPAAMKNIVDIACAGQTTSGNWTFPTRGKKGVCKCDGTECLNEDQTYGCSGETCTKYTGIQNEADCSKSCKPSKPSYHCDSKNLICVSGGGPFTTETDCKKICVEQDISKCTTYGDYLPYSSNYNFCCKQDDYHFDTDISGSGCNATASACYLNKKPSELCPGTDMSMCSPL